MKMPAAPPVSSAGPVSAPVAGVVQPVLPVLRASTFFWPLRFLAPSRRQGMVTLYRFCRLMDDLVDEPVPAGGASPAQALAAWRFWLRAGLPSGDPPATAAVPPGLPQALAAAVTAFSLPVAELVAIIDGVAMDLPPSLLAPDLATLRRYCRGVAGAVGQLTVRILDQADPETERLATVLGEALQFTNILRDLDEDAARGRLYLPAEVLAAAGLAVPEPARPETGPDTARSLALLLADPALTPACDRLAAAARQAYAEAATLFAGWPRRRLWPVRAMFILYHRLLQRQQQAGWRQPVHLSGQEKLTVAARCLCGWPPVR